MPSAGKRTLLAYLIELLVALSEKSMKSRPEFNRTGSKRTLILRTSKLEQTNLIKINTEVLPEEPLKLIKLRNPAVQLAKFKQHATPQILANKKLTISNLKIWPL